MRKLLLLIGLWIAFPLLSQKLMITGEPIILEHTGQYYTVPANYPCAKIYNYVTIEGKNRVCYLDKQPNLNNLDVIIINVSTESKIIPWNCYAFDDTVFEAIE